MTEPDVSVVVAVRNGVEIIQRCLDSVLTQELGRAELVVIDGASMDGTVEVLQHNASRLAFWSSEPDRGICDAWNKALEHVRGEWVLFLGADDRLAAADVLTRASDALARLADDTLVAYGRVDVIDQDGVIIARPGRPWSEARVGFAAYNTIPHQGVFHRRRLFELVGRFDERFRIAGDYELLIRAFKITEPAFIDLLIAEFSGVGLSARPENMFAATREAYVARYVNGLERLPDWASPRVYRALAFELVRRTAGQGVARRLADRYHGRSGEPPLWGPPTV
jgi:glycosyltransferase involved in cell wall biosynthesis